MAATSTQIYVVRIWYEPTPEGVVWRASVSQGEERHYFAELSALIAFLQQEMETESEERPQ
ncbi:MULTISPECIES: hypothetical protein [unclassified Meiothermus]|uniref:hypothetical protein n=1 Tax=unclassified Meiothermus TaxID=370471 RepID=UPI000D7CB037|nr:MULTISPECIES: hypothetical protein [unclassified Meiothermus]PZA07321.1 hypothetical protein DNA98_08985 [Meiothermus sp. Pnk-1]RYM37314.1 hypothetical protein EWH23_06410 [Meiothermus sp. PNK-Is4]